MTTDNLAVADVLPGMFITATSKNGKTSITGPVADSRLNGVHFIDIVGITIQGLSYRQWTFKQAEPPAAPFPTIPGFYLDNEGGLWRLLGNNRWEYEVEGKFYTTVSNAITNNYLPFRRLTAEAL